MITARGSRATTLEKLRQIASDGLKWVEVVTTPNIGQQYSGSLALLPVGGPYYAVQGKLKVMLRRHPDGEVTIE